MSTTVYQHFTSAAKVDAKRLTDAGGAEYVRLNLEDNGVYLSLFCTDEVFAKIVSQLSATVPLPVPA